MTTPALEVTDLQKIYTSRFGKRKITAIEQLDLKVEQGELFGLLGPNGAGKTTTVKILLGLTHPTRGTAFIQGKSVSDPESRRKVGYLPEGHRFPGYLTGRETLSIFGRLSGMDSPTLNSRMKPLLEQLRIAEWMDVKVKKYSKGMTQRLGLASALIHHPEVLLLDEPTDGVDPVGRREIRDLLREIAHQGTTVFVNSHLLSEIELTCDRVAVLRKGKMAACGRIDELTASTDPRYRMVASSMDERLMSSFRETGAGVERQNGHLLLTVKDLEQLNALVDRLRQQGGILSELAPVRTSLEDLFVDLIKTGDAAAGSEVSQ